MAERFKKTYITAREFVNSWEKEIYELNNLDYFIFLLINDLGWLIEREYFKHIDRKNDLFLSTEDIGNLVFNLGDSLQMFFEKNCFGSCSLHCPSRLNEEITNEEKQNRITIIDEFNNQIATCHSKEQCLYLDLMNYVVLDTLLDFYNYELKIILDESEDRLTALAEFIMDIIIEFTKQKGQHLLFTPRENAGDRFKDSLDDDDSPWHELIPELEEEEEDETEIWKSGDTGVRNILSDFRQKNETGYDEDILYFLNKFEEYVTDFLEVKRIDELDVEDLEEFFLVILVSELTDREKSAPEPVIQMFNHLFNHIEFDYDFDLKTLFDSSKFKLEDFLRIIDINRKYQSENPLLDFLISPESQDESQIEGYFQVVKRMEPFYTLKDIHLNTYFKPVKLGPLATMPLRMGDILHVQMIMGEPGWQVTRLEMIFPHHSKNYLF